MEGIELWIDGYSNCGVKIRTNALKASLIEFQNKYPERRYELKRVKGLWYISQGAKK